MKNALLKSTAGVLAVLWASSALAADPAFKVFGRVVTMDEVVKDKQGEFYEIEQKKYELLKAWPRKPISTRIGKSERPKQKPQ